MELPTELQNYKELPRKFCTIFSRRARGSLSGLISAVSESSIIHGHNGHKLGVIITRGYTYTNSLAGRLYQMGNFGV